MRIKNFIARNIIFSILSFFAASAFVSLAFAGFDLQKLTTSSILQDAAFGLVLGTLFYFHRKQERKQQAARKGL